MDLLSVEHVSYSYGGGLNVLEDVSLAMSDGEIVGLIGPNGSGKSTLIKNIFDLLRLQAGGITVAGLPHHSTSAKREGMYLSSNDYLPQFLTAREYIEMLARLYGVAVDDAAAEDLFSRFSMWGRYDHLIEDFSHGMRKKTQLISALLTRRPLTVVDETLNGIDLEALYLTEKEFGRLRDEGSSILLCTHDFSLLERLADRIVFLDLGQVVSDQSIAAIIERHGSLASMVFSHLDSEARGT